MPCFWLSFRPAKVLSRGRSARYNESKYSDGRTLEFLPARTSYATIDVVATAARPALFSVL